MAKNDLWMFKYWSWRGCSSSSSEEDSSNGLLECGEFDDVISGAQPSSLNPVSEELCFSEELWLKKWLIWL